MTGKRRRGSKARPRRAGIGPVVGVGTLMTWEEFLEDVEGGMLIDYDGFGELVTADLHAVSRVEVSPSNAADLVRPDWATHVVWYNR